MKYFEVTSLFQVEATDYKEAEEAAFSLSSEQYVGEPDNPALFSRRVKSVSQVDGQPTTKSTLLSLVKEAFHLKHFEVQVVLTIQATDEEKARKEALLCCSDRYLGEDRGKPVIKSYGYGNHHYYTIVTDWKVVDVKEIAPVPHIEILPQEVIDMLPKYQEPRDENMMVYVKFYEPKQNLVWYASEGDYSYDVLGNDDFDFSGLIVANGNKVVGDFSLSELKDIRRIYGTPVIRDIHFTPIPLKQLLFPPAVQTNEERAKQEQISDEIPC